MNKQITVEEECRLILSGLWLKSKGLYIPITDNQINSHHADVEEAMNALRYVLGKDLDKLAPTNPYNASRVTLK